MKFLRKHYPLIISLIVALFVGRALLTSQHFHTHDDLQVFRLNEFLSCLDDGQLPCRWSSQMGKGYGYPYFNFYPPMIYALPALIHSITGASLIFSLNIFAYLTFPLAAYGMYLLARGLTDNSFVAMVASVLYTLTPYHAVNIFVRGVYAENLAWALLPYLLYFTYRLLSKGKSFFLLTLTLAILFLTHNISTLIFTPLLAAWALLLSYLNHNWQNLRRFLFSYLLSLGLSAFFLLPAVLEKSLVQTDSMIHGYYQYFNHFVSVGQVFVSNFWGYGGSNYETAYDGMSFALGYSLTIGALILVPLTTLIKKISLKDNLSTFFFTISGLLAIFMTHAKSIFIWQLFPLLPYIQFPWRFIGTAATLLVVATALIITRLPKRAMQATSFLLMVIALLTNWTHFQPESYDQYKDTDYISGKFLYDQQSAHIYDYLPVDAHSIPDEFASSFVFRSTSDYQILSHAQASNSLSLTIEARQEQSLTLAHYYYPGWQAKLDGQAVEITSDLQYGFVTLTVPAGEHLIELDFVDTPIRTIANLISIISLLVFGFLLYTKRRHVK